MTILSIWYLHALESCSLVLTLPVCFIVFLNLFWIQRYRDTCNTSSMSMKHSPFGEGLEAWIQVLVQSNVSTQAGAPPPGNLSGCFNWVMSIWSSLVLSLTVSNYWHSAVKFLAFPFVSYSFYLSAKIIYLNLHIFHSIVHTFSSNSSAFTFLPKIAHTLK